MVTCFFVRLFFYQCWPDGPLDTNVDFDFHRLSFYLQNECLCQTSVSHENHANDRAGDIYFHTNSFAQRLVLPQGQK